MKLYRPLNQSTRELSALQIPWGVSFNGQQAAGCQRIICKKYLSAAQCARNDVKQFGATRGGGL